MRRVAVLAVLLAVGVQSTSIAQSGDARWLADMIGKKMVCLLPQISMPDDGYTILAQSQCGPPGCCSTTKCLCERKSDGSVSHCTTK